MGLVNRWSTLRLKGSGPVASRREIGALAIVLVLAAGMATMATEAETSFVSRWLTVNGAVAVSWVLFLAFSYAVVVFVWLRMRDAGVVPLAYARRRGEGWVLGSLTRVLFRRMVRFGLGDVVEIGTDTSYPVSTGPSRRMMYEWSFRASGARLPFRTVYPLGPGQIAAVSAWLEALGLDSDASI